MKTSRARGKCPTALHTMRSVVAFEPPDDLERDPGIGASKGTAMSGADAENDAGRPGAGVDPRRVGRGSA